MSIKGHPQSNFKETPTLSDHVCAMSDEIVIRRIVSRNNGKRKHKKTTERRRNICIYETCRAAQDRQMEELCSCSSISIIPNYKIANYDKLKLQYNHKCSDFHLPLQPYCSFVVTITRFLLHLSISGISKAIKVLQSFIERLCLHQFNMLDISLSSLNQIAMV